MDKKKISASRLRRLESTGAKVQVKPVERSESEKVSTLLTPFMDMLKKVPGMIETAVSNAVEKHMAKIEIPAPAPAKPMSRTIVLGDVYRDKDGNFAKNTVIKVVSK